MRSMRGNSHKRIAKLNINAIAAPPLLLVLAIIIAAALIQGDAPTTHAQQPGATATATPAPDAGAAFPPPDAAPALGNLDSILSRIVERVEQGISTADSAAADAPVSRGNSVAVTFHTQGDPAALAAFLRANGGDPRGAGVGYLEAYVPITLLVAASERPGVIRAQAIVPPQSATAPLSPEDISAPAGKGNVVSQAVALHGADAWHAAGYTGAGVKVGVIAAGFAGATALTGSELPAASAIAARCYTGVSGFTSNLADCQTNHIQGAIAAESLLDIAPDASLYVSNPQSLAAFREAVDWMVGQGVAVINFPGGWSWDGPGDGASPFRDSPLQAVDAAVNGGAIFVTAAGDFQGSTWLGAWSDPDADRILNFGANTASTEAPAPDELNGVFLDANERLIVFLRWQDRWGGASTDLNLTLYNADGAIAASGATPQTGEAAHVPIEAFSFVAPADGIYNIAVNIGEGDAPPQWAQLQAFTRQALTFPSEGGSIGNPAESANPGMLAVGAARYWDATAIAASSGRGPTPDGRTKPDITAADCAQVAAIQATNLSNGRQCWYSGTGQAAAHVAGLAALVKQRFPNYAPAQIAAYLTTNAQPRGAKPNNAWGHGFAVLPAPPIADRVTALERQNDMILQLLQNLQSLIQALTNRIAALEGGGAPIPTPTATATPTATPSPTPTSVPGTDPPPTPITGDACIQPITPGATAGAWTTACVTANAPDDNTYYAKFYTFTLDARAEVSITLFATTPTYLYLLSGAGTGGGVEQEAGDPPSPTTTLTATLLPGSYTIEATTYNPETTGDFTIELTIAP